MKFFPKTFLYTLTLLVLIALLANGLVYALMPKAYTRQKQRNLSAQADKLAQKLENGKQEDIVSLMGDVAAQGQTNIIVRVGEEKYALIVWSGGEKRDSSVTTYVTITKGTDSENVCSVSAPGPDSDSGNVSGMVITDRSAEPALDGLYSSVHTIGATRNFTMDGRDGSLLLTMTLAPVEEAVNVIVTLIPISIILCLVIAVIFSLLYARAITRPIKMISEETRQMTALDRDAKCRISSKDEFGELADNVNGLYENLLCTIDFLEAELKKVAAAEKSKSDFLRAASHELKTPVTAVSVIMDNMILGVGRYKNYGEWLPKCRALVDSLSAKLHEILEVSSFEEITEPYATQSVEELCSEILEPYIIIARAKGLSIFADWSASFTITAPPRLLEKALSNIFSNAVQYTAPGGKLSVYCRGRSLVVENECAPIPEDQLKRLFEPFFRPDASRSRETGGNGLGLFIVETILSRVGLDYRFEPMSSPDGMRFTITF